MHINVSDIKYFAGRSTRNHIRGRYCTQTGIFCSWYDFIALNNAKYVFSCRKWLGCNIDTYLCVVIGIYPDWSMILQCCLRLNRDSYLYNVLVLGTHSCLDSVADSMSVWNLLREFRIRKVHMAVVLNEYGGTVGVSLYS